MVCIPASGSTFPIGSTTVSCTATDAAGNTSSCTFKVIVLPSLVSIERAIIIRWNCGETLQAADNVNGPWTDIPGATRPNEVVMIGAHFDSWHYGTGATDNAAGSAVMLEAMRILKKCYPSPRRTILAGHWGSEEQGLNGSRAFVLDHPEIIAKLQALFNQDNGTGRISSMSASGFTRKRSIS